MGGDSETSSTVCALSTAPGSAMIELLEVNELGRPPSSGTGVYSEPIGPILQRTKQVLLNHCFWGVSDSVSFFSAWRDAGR